MASKQNKNKKTKNKKDEKIKCQSFVTDGYTEPQTGVMQRWINAHLYKTSIFQESQNQALEENESISQSDQAIIKPSTEPTDKSINHQNSHINQLIKLLSERMYS